jgi:outer membrane immunogenic protein
MALMSSVFALTGGPAQAADLGGKQVYAPPPAVYDEGPRPYSWSGFYLGVNGGYGWGNSDWTFPGTADTLAFKETGAMAGGQVGLNWQFAKSMVAGVEGTVDWANLGGKATCPAGDSTCKTQFNATADISGRLGFAFNRFMIYGKGGVAFADMKHLNTSLVDTSMSVSSGYDVKTGYLVGGGLEYAITDHISWKLEYNYSNFGSSNYTLNNAAGGASPITEDQSISAVKAGLNFKF